ncbi:MAG: nitroreductase family protein [Halobacteriota archaeon]
MEKPADDVFQIHEPLKRRLSLSAFAERLVEHAKLRSMSEGGHWAPSAFSVQPSSFIIAAKGDLNGYICLLDCMLAVSQPWAHCAPALPRSITNFCHPDTGKPARSARYSLGLAMENLVLQAAALSLFFHQTDGMNVEKARTEFNIPKENEPADVIEVRNLGNLDALPDDLCEKELARMADKPLTDHVFRKLE